MPDWELRLWTESNFDCESNPFVREAYRQGLYAFVSDYVRLWAVHLHGGIYLDIDVELLRPLDDICTRGAWLAREEGQAGTFLPALGLGFGLPRGHWLSSRMLDAYARTEFPDTPEGLHAVTVVKMVASVLIPIGLSTADELQHIDDLVIYPSEYFAPRGYHSHKLRITPQTHSIHHYHASWMPRSQRLKDYIVRRLGRLGTWLLQLKNRLRGLD